MESIEYSANHEFAVLFTFVAALSQGLGGLIAVLGVGTEEAGTSTAHLMSFSTGVMLYLSFMDIIADTTSKIGEFYANVAFFLGMVIFLMLEFCLPEVEGSQMAEIFGLNLRVDLRKTPQLRDTSGSEHVEPMEPLPVAMSSGELGSSSLRRRDRHQTAPLEFAGNPQPTALKQKPTTSEHPRAPSRSPVHRPAQTAMTEAEQHQGSPVGGQSIRTKANSIAFTVCSPAHTCCIADCHISCCARPPSTLPFPPPIRTS